MEISSDAVLSGKQPDHQHETCVIIDYTWSLGYMLMASGDAEWADVVERAIYNAGYSVISKDFKSMQFNRSAVPCGVWPIPRRSLIGAATDWVSVYMDDNPYATSKLQVTFR